MARIAWPKPAWLRPGLERSGGMAASTQIGRVLGVPIRVHVSLWIFLPLIASMFVRQDLLLGLVVAAGLFGCIALHELGHALVARAKGCRVREILLLPIGGIARMDREPDHPRDEILVALAGPVVSVILAVLCFIASLACRQAGWLLPTVIFAAWWRINLMLAFFNLLPSFPMDGGRVFRAWMTPRVGKLEATRRAARIGKITAVALGALGLLTWNLVMVAMAVFIYIAAEMEYRLIQAREFFRAPGSPFAGPAAPPADTAEADITVSPPPYARGGARRPAPRAAPRDAAFDDLYHRWR